MANQQNQGGGGIAPPVGLWKTTKGLIADTVGPMALLGIAAQKFVSASAGAALNAQRMQQVLAASDGAEKLRIQFEQLLGSTSAARKQVEMLAKVASTGAFNFESLAEASKNLQVLTKGALNSERALKQVQDVAAATGAPVDAVAAAVGELYAALEDGRGVEGAADQLERLGVISGQTTDKLKALSGAGVSVSASWKAVEADLGRAAGAASALGGTIAGLQQQLAAIQQQSDTRIGEMFVEGEKAGYRAAIGFEKFTAAVREANAGPWAEVNKSINSVKEAIGGFLGRVAETGAVKTVFEKIAAVAVGTLATTTAALIAAIPFFLKLAVSAGGAATGALGRFAASVGVTSTVLGRMGASLKGILFNKFTVGATAASVIAGELAARIFKAAAAVDNLNQKMKSQSEEWGKSWQGTDADVKTVRTPEERDAAESQIKQRLKDSETRKKGFEDQVKEGRRMQDSMIPWVRQGGEEIEKGANAGIRRENDLQMFLQNSLSDLSGKPVSADQKLLEISQQRLELEKQIASEAKRRVESVVSPEAASKMAAENVKIAEKEFDYANTATKNRYEDDKKLSSANQKFQDSQGARDTYVRNVEEQIKRSRSAILESAPKSNQFEVNRALENDDFDELERLAKTGAIKSEDVQSYRAAKEEQKKGAGRPQLDYGAFDTNAVSDSGKIQAEIAKRAAMQAEERDAFNKGDNDRVFAVRQKMAELVNPLTGQSELSGNKEAQDLKAQLSAATARGDQDQVRELQGRLGEIASADMGRSDPRLQSELKSATDKEDVVGKQAALEEARVRDQAAKVAEAAAKGEIDAAQKRLDLEKQISALRGGGDAAEKQAIQKEYEDSVGRTAEKRTALAAVDSTGAAYNAMLNSEAVKKLPGNPDDDTEGQKAVRAQLEAARSAFEAAQAFAASKGVQAGDSKESYDLEDKAAKARQDAATQQNAEQSSARRGRMGREEQDARRQRVGRDTSAGERSAAAASEGVAKMANIARAEQAAKDYEAARKEGNTEKMNAAKTQLAATGFAGMGVDDIEQIKKTEMEILSIKQQQAQVDMAASAKRNQDAMQALRSEQQRTQLTLNQAQGKDSGTTGWQIEEKDLMRKKGELESALPKAREKEQLTVQAEAANALAGISEKFGGDQAAMEKAVSELPAGVREAAQAFLSGGGATDSASLNAQAKALTVRRDQLETELASAGVSGKSADEIRQELGGVANQINANSAQRSLNREQSVRDQRIAMLRTQEEYGPADQREAAKRERKGLEDETMRRDLKQSYIDKGYREDEAGDLANTETARNRLVSDMGEAGNARVDSLTAVGGGATGFMGGMKEDNQKRIADLNEQIKNILSNIEKHSRDQIQRSERAMQLESERL